MLVSGIQLALHGLLLSTLMCAFSVSISMNKRLNRIALELVYQSVFLIYPVGQSYYHLGLSLAWFTFPYQLLSKTHCFTRIIH